MQVPGKLKIKKIAKQLIGKLRPRSPGEWPEGQRELYRRFYSERAIRNRRFYNVGAGLNFRHPAWSNLGQPSETYGDQHLDLVWDLQLLGPMPVPNSAAEIIYSRYTLEHVTDGAVASFLKEAHRALRPGGFLRVIVPDIEIYYAAYRAKDATLFYKPKRDRQTYPNKKFKTNPNKASLEQQFLWVFASGATELHNFEGIERISDAQLASLLKERRLEEGLDFCTARCTPEFQRAFPQFHINWFHERKLERMMREAGFATPYRSGLGESHSPVLRDLNFFDNRRPEIALFMEAVK